MRRSLVVALVAGTILVASLLPAGSDAAGGLPPDELLHAVAYAGLAATVCWWRVAAPTPGPSRPRSLAMVVVAVALYGGVVELLQTPLPTRTGSLSDLGANAVGAVVGVAGWLLVDDGARTD